MTTREELMQQRMNLLLPTAQQLRQELRPMNRQLLARRAGAEWHDRSLHLRLLGQEHAIEWPDLGVRVLKDGREARMDTQVLLLTYLRNADGTPPTGSWLSFRQLPDGGFYHRAFQGYAADRLAQRFGEDINSFHKAAQSVGGRRESMGDASYGFQALPHVWLAAVLWQGDEEFPAAARILFDESCSRYLATDLLATLGRLLVGRLLKSADQATEHSPE